MDTGRWLSREVERLGSHLKTQLRENELARRLYGDIDIFRKYGTFRPERVAMLRSDHSIFVDASEPRGRALLRGFCGGQPRLKSLWLSALEKFQPDVVLDVGVNYGEFLFLPTYADEVKVFGVEPAPHLKKYIERSLAMHPSREQIQLHYKAAGADHGGTVKFYYDEAWSGRSSVVQKANLKQPVEVDVARTTIDDILADEMAEGDTLKLLFKIDVESYEPEVLRGMCKTIESSECVGILEFDPQQLRGAGHDPDDFLKTLSDTFKVWALQRGADERPVETRGDLEYPEKHADLLLLSDASLAPLLGVDLA